MGINLKDLGNFAVGAIEKDRELTKEKLLIRAEELKANRDLMIAMKKDKYASDIANYDAERKKANEIQKLNSVASMDSQSYAKQYLLHSLGVEKFNALKNADPEGFKDMITNTANAALENGNLDYKFSLDRSSIDNQFNTDTKIINKGFANAIESAKGDSFLINKLLRKKSTINEDVNSNIEEQLKAAKVVTEETVDAEKPKIKLTEGVKSKRKPPEAYETEFSSLQKAAKFDSLNNKDNLLNFINASNNLGFTSQMNFKFDDKDKVITGTTPSSQAFLNSYKLVYENILKQNNATDLYNYVTTNKSDLVNIVDADAINRKVQNIILTRQNKIDTGKGSWEDNRELITMLPLNIVDVNNQTKIGNKVIDIDISESSKVYNDFLKSKAKTLYAGSNLDEFTKLSNIQQLIENGQPSLVNELKNKLIEIKTKPEEVVIEEPVKTPDTGTPKVKKITITDSGISDGNNLLTWQTIEKTNQVNKLNTEQKAAYDKWKAKQVEPNTQTSGINNDADTVFSNMVNTIEADITGKKKTARK